MDDRQLEQTHEERLVGLDYDPSLSWSSHIANLRKKKYLMLVLSLFLNTVFPFGEVVMQDYWMRFLKFKKDVLVLY